jgi:hypothetical protein
VHQLITEPADGAPLPGWTPVWAMPNVTLDEPIEASHAALVPCSDERLCEAVRLHPTLETFVRAFRDEFGTQIEPAIGMVREDAPTGVKTVTAFGGFRDAICLSAIAAGQSLSLTSKRGGIGIVHSDAFDVFPWFPALEPGLEKYVRTFTPMLAAMHEVEALQPQCAPALGRRSLSASHIDHPLLRALLARWERCFVSGSEAIEDRRLFRSLEMARAASKVPGGVDATEHHAGRAVALWVSAFEILAHDGKWSGLKEVLIRLGEVQWRGAKLKVQDRQVKIGKKKTFQTNVAGEVYGHLYRVRNAFLHGEEVTPETLKLRTCQRSVLFFAAPLFRLALTAFLDLCFSETLPDTASGEDLGRHIAKRMEFNGPERLAEDAILIADEALDQKPPAG